MFGSPRTCWLIGLGGNDLLVGGPGTDRFEAGPGNDLMSARDGAAEIVRGQQGFDRARVDAGLDKRPRGSSSLSALAAAARPLSRRVPALRSETEHEPATIRRSRELAGVR